MEVRFESMLFLWDDKIPTMFLEFMNEVVQLRQFLNNMERDSIKWISFSFVLLLFSS